MFHMISSEYNSPQLDKGRHLERRLFVIIPRWVREDQKVISVELFHTRLMVFLYRKTSKDRPLR